MSDEVRPDRHALLELDAILQEIERRRDAGTPERYFSDDDYRWVIHRLWIAAGNEANAYLTLSTTRTRPGSPWRVLYRIRNSLAHGRLPDIDDHQVWRITALRTSVYRADVRRALT